MLINRLGLVKFFDDDTEASRDASAIKAVAGEELGLALLLRYFAEHGRNPVRVGRKPVQVRDPARPTQGAAGHRLDAWVRVTNGAGSLLYQVEVKTWSSHSIGGARLSFHAFPVDIRAYKRAQWDKYFEPGCGFHEPALQKVFDPMVSPEPGTPVEPLACLWTAVHAQGGDESFFQVPVTAARLGFKLINVFSMSAYLRTLPEAPIDLPLPDTQRRLQCLSSLFLPRRPGSPARPAGQGLRRIAGALKVSR